MITRYQEQAPVQELCKWAEVSKSSFHYKSHPGPRGMKASLYTPIGGALVENIHVVEQIRAVLGLAAEQEHDSLVVNSFNKNVQLLGG